MIRRVHNVRSTSQKRPQNSHNKGDQVQKQNMEGPKMILLLTRYPPLRDTADDSITVSRKTLLL